MSSTVAPSSRRSRSVVRGEARHHRRTSWTLHISISSFTAALKFERDRPSKRSAFSQSAECTRRPSGRQTTAKRSLRSCRVSMDSLTDKLSRFSLTRTPNASAVSQTGSVAAGPLFAAPEPSLHKSVTSSMSKRKVHANRSWIEVTPLNDSEQLRSRTRQSRPLSIVAEDLNKVPEEFTPIAHQPRPVTEVAVECQSVSGSLRALKTTEGVQDPVVSGIGLSLFHSMYGGKSLGASAASTCANSAVDLPSLQAATSCPVPPTVLVTPGKAKASKIKALLSLHRKAVSSTEIVSSVTAGKLTMTSTSSTKTSTGVVSSARSLPQTLLRSSSATLISSSMSSSLSRDQRRKSGIVRETNAIQPFCMERSAELMAVVKERLGVEEVEGFINQYAIIKSIGEGSFGKVFLVYNLSEDRYFACKNISKKRLRKKSLWKRGPPRKSIENADGVKAALANNNASNFDYMELVRREIAILKKLSRHTNIATLVEVLDDNSADSLYMVFELCEYGPIMRLKQTEVVRPFSEDLARRYFRDVLLGLEYLHHLGIVHRDLKPENILLNADNHAVIGDFSISLCNKQSSQILNNALVDTGNAILTPSFTPPEMIADFHPTEGVSPCEQVTQPQTMYGTDLSKLEYSERTDIWSLGVTLFCFVHGHIPFAGCDLQSLYKSIREDPVANLLNPGLSCHLQNLLLRLLDRDPKRRITLPEIRKHAWTTRDGQDPLVSCSTNCQLEGAVISEEDLKDALHPVTGSWWLRLKAKMGKSRRENKHG